MQSTPERKSHALKLRVLQQPVPPPPVRRLLWQRHLFQRLIVTFDR